eukprot:TRINITY_DN46359_c0_g1_i2.p1 TRINITY_DN46359_c0_g1~~TRINITY_DN46359_c0_g1_i2.p1  ORF type:complete len:472 (-),score=108.21 TRINITY_DN46359_c0_g1_i2:22-1413(-)
MARLRPWNVFAKTVYQGGGSRAPGSPLLFAQISQARARVRSDGPDDSAEGFQQRLRLLLPCSAAVWGTLVLTYCWCGDAERGPERIRRLCEKPLGAMVIDFLGWRVTAHLGPYQVPALLRANLQQEPLERLREPLLLDYERAAAVARLAQLTQRRQGALVLAGRSAEDPGAGEAAGGLARLEPLLRILFDPEAALEAIQSAGGSSSFAIHSHRSDALGVLLDVAVALPPEERTVPPWVLSGLVTATGPPWDTGPQAEELRATLLVRLLGSPANCATAASLPEVRDYLQQLGAKAYFDTGWAMKAFLLSGETRDLLRKGALLVNRQCPGELEVAPRRPRETPSLQVKRDLRNAWTTALLTIGWTSFRTWTGGFNLAALVTIGKASAQALAGTGLLEGLWRVEESVIQSDWYYAGGYPMFGASASMVLANCVAGAWAFRFPTLVPFLICRLVKDDVLDAYRSFES